MSKTEQTEVPMAEYITLNKDSVTSPAATIIKEDCP
jgi:hypothetical protein